MNDDEFEDRLRSLRPREPSARLDARVAEAVEAGRPRASRSGYWSLAAALLAGVVLGYGVARIEGSRGAEKTAPTQPSVRVYIVREGSGMLDFSPEYVEGAGEPPVIRATANKPSST